MKAGARAMADGKILDQTTVLGSPKLVGGGLQAGDAVSRQFQATPMAQSQLCRWSKYPQKKHLTFTNQGSALGPLPIFSRYPGYYGLQAG